MKREIKFRAWDFHRISREMQMFSHEQIRNNSARYITDNETFPDRIIMQYTGLKDKKGKDIYDGDVIKYKQKYLPNSDRIGQVFFSEFRASFSVKSSEFANSDLYSLVQNGNVVEVIGNIYQNPELLS